MLTSDKSDKCSRFFFMEFYRHPNGIIIIQKLLPVRKKMFQKTNDYSEKLKYSFVTSIMNSIYQIDGEV